MKILITMFFISLFLVVLPFIISGFLYKYYPKSKLANFCRRNIVSDVDMDKYDNYPLD